MPQDYAQAVIWYRKAADQGFANAQFHLSLLYLLGRGVTQDDAQAVVWCRKAADQGHAKAQAVLGDFYYRGDGVAQNYEEAYFWLNLAAAGTPGADRENVAKARTILSAAMLTSEEVSTVQERAAKWFAKHPHH